MSEKLKSCPFCGNEAVVEGYDDCFFVRCPFCQAETSWDIDKEHAIANWNERRKTQNETDMYNLIKQAVNQCSHNGIYHNLYQEAMRILKAYETD